jgi:hypothetical protein
MPCSKQQLVLDGPAVDLLLGLGDRAELRPLVVGLGDELQGGRAHAPADAFGGDVARAAPGDAVDQRLAQHLA